MSKNYKERLNLIFQKDNPKYEEIKFVLDQELDYRLSCIEEKSEKLKLELEKDEVENKEE